jgi:hypothetical protein
MQLVYAISFIDVCIATVCLLVWNWDSIILAASYLLIGLLTSLTRISLGAGYVEYSGYYLQRAGCVLMENFYVRDNEISGIIP